jgi:hypothetical protein
MLTSFSWLSSSLPFYSPPSFLDFRASVAGGARIHSSCIESPNYLVKRKVIDEGEKSEVLEEMMRVEWMTFEVFSRLRCFNEHEIAFSEGSPAPQFELG